MKDFKHPKFPTIHIKLLNSTEDLTQLESLLKTDAQAISGYVPQESSKDSKYMYGIFDNDQLIGIIDLIEEYPTKQGAYIHQFFLADDYNRDNLAEMLYSALEKTVQETGIMSLTIDDTLANTTFWNEQGYDKSTTKSIA